MSLLQYSVITKESVGKKCLSTLWFVADRSSKTLPVLRTKGLRGGFAIVNASTTTNIFTYNQSHICNCPDCTELSSKFTFEAFQRKLQQRNFATCLMKIKMLRKNQIYVGLCGQLCSTFSQPLIQRGLCMIFNGI